MIRREHRDLESLLTEIVANSPTHYALILKDSELEARKVVVGLALGLSSYLDDRNLAHAPAFRLRREWNALQAETARRASEHVE